MEQGYKLIGEDESTLTFETPWGVTLTTVKHPMFHKVPCEKFIDWTKMLSCINVKKSRFASIFLSDKYGNTIESNYMYDLLPPYELPEISDMDLND